jgi:hypothetical protein
MKKKLIEKYINRKGAGWEGEFVLLNTCFQMVKKFSGIAYFLDSPELFILPALFK